MQCAKHSTIGGSAIKLHQGASVSEASWCGEWGRESEKTRPFSRCSRSSRLREQPAFWVPDMELISNIRFSARGYGKDAADFNAASHTPVTPCLPYAASLWAFLHPFHPPRCATQPQSARCLLHGSWMAAWSFQSLRRDRHHHFSAQKPGTPVGAHYLIPPSPPLPHSSFVLFDA